MLKKSCLFAVLASSAAVFAQDPEVKINPISIGASQELGVIHKGQYTVKEPLARPFEDDWVDHFGASIGMSAVVNERLYVSAGLGGIFQFRKPESINIGYEGSQRKAFFIGPATEAVYHFGEDPAKPTLQIGMGNFWYKYNPDASNLGEYLFRSEGYPTYTYTGGYSIIGSAGAQLQGFKALWRHGKLKLDMFVTTETNLAPFYDWSPGAVVSYSVADGLLDLGAGVNFKHLIQVKPSRSQQENNENGYFRHDGEWYYASSTFYGEQAAFYNEKFANGGTAQDSIRGAAAQDRADTVENLIGTGAVNIKYFDSRSNILMARASLDFKKLLQSDLFGPQDLKLYTEISVLGTKDYPVFYKNVKERMPIMVGFNLPTPKAFDVRLLDLLSLQAEYLNAPYMNSTYARSVYGANVPFYPLGSDRVMSKNVYNDITDRDNFKWSVLAKKSLGNVTFSVQAASDHLRLPSSAFYYGPQFDPMEITVTKQHWYIMSQIAWGI